MATVQFLHSPPLLVGSFICLLFCWGYQRSTPKDTHTERRKRERESTTCRWWKRNEDCEMQFEKKTNLLSWFFFRCRLARGIEISKAPNRSQKTPRFSATYIHSQQTTMTQGKGFFSQVDWIVIQRYMCRDDHFSIVVCWRLKASGSITWSFGKKKTNNKKLFFFEEQVGKITTPSRQQ